MLTIDCPPSPVQPNSTVQATGTTSNCDGTVATTSVDGNEIPHTWSCDNGRFSISLTAPSCELDSSNVILFQVALGAETASCSVEIDCE